MKPVERLHRVTFPNPDELRAWRIRVLEYAATVGGLPTGAESRLVVFVPLLPKGRRSVHAYVSEGARSLARDFSREAHIDDAAVSLRELPDGLTLIYGEGVDASAYEHRREG